MALGAGGGEILHQHPAPRGIGLVATGAEFRRVPTLLGVLKMLFQMRDVIEENPRAAGIRVTGEVGMPRGETLELLLVTALALGIIQRGQPVALAPVFLMAGAAGEFASGSAGVAEECGTQRQRCRA